LEINADEPKPPRRIQQGSKANKSGTVNKFLPGKPENANSKDEQRGSFYAKGIMLRRTRRT